MKNGKSHVGRPTNEEVEKEKKIKIKKLRNDILCIIIGIIILGYLTSSLNINFNSFHIILGVVLVLIWFIKRRM